MEEQKYMEMIRNTQSDLNKIRNGTYNFEVKPLFALKESKEQGQPVWISPEIMTYIEVFEGLESIDKIYASIYTAVGYCTKYPNHFKQPLPPMSPKPAE